MPNSCQVHDSHSVNIASDNGNNADCNETGQFPCKRSLENLRSMKAMENAKKEARVQASLTKELITSPGQRRTSLGCMGRVHTETRKWGSSSRNTETRRQKEDLYCFTFSSLCTKERQKLN